MVRNMFAVNRAAAPNSARDESLTGAKRVSARIRRNGERGAALVEFAMIVPLFAIITFGMCSIGFLFNQYLELTEAVNVGGQQLALARGNYGDPCQSVAGFVVQASPALSVANMTFSYNINGSAYTFAKGATGSSLSCTSAPSPIKGGYPVSLTVQYACGGIITMTFGNLGNFSPLPASACTFQSQITEISQ
jgi:hypothetical protein